MTKPIIKLTRFNSKCTSPSRVSEYYPEDEGIILRNAEGEALCPTCEKKAHEVSLRNNEIPKSADDYSAETWRKMPYTCYEISNKRNIRRRYKNGNKRILSVFVAKGVCVVSLCVKGKSMNRSVNSIMEEVWG
jgi:uncharacterized Zn finger protein (UPF0148 family)